MYHHMQMARRGRVGSNSAKCQYLIDCLARGFLPVPKKVAEDLTIDEACA
jgi:hypothetical protein